MIVGLYGVNLCLLMLSVLSIGGFGELGETNCIGLRERSLALRLWAGIWAV